MRGPLGVADGLARIPDHPSRGPPLAGLQRPRTPRRRCRYLQSPSTRRISRRRSASHNDQLSSFLTCPSHSANQESRPRTCPPWPKVPFWPRPVRRMLTCGHKGETRRVSTASATSRHKRHASPPSHVLESWKDTRIQSRWTKRAARRLPTGPFRHHGFQELAHVERPAP
jgi:hypothetical protein